MTPDSRHGCSHHIAGIVVFLALVGGLGYNSLVRRKNRTAEAWSQIDVKLKRRHDLIPNLIQTVKGYAAHESGTFEAVTASRAAAVSAGASADPAAVASAENGLNRSLRSLFAVAENYPALRAEEGFLALQEQLAASEDKLEYARRYYNTSARDRTIASGYSVRGFPWGPVSAPVTWDELPNVEMRDFTIATMPARFAQLGDLHAGMDDAVWSIEPLLEWADRDETDRKLGDAPYPPNFPKQAGEPPRVQPSRMNKANWGVESSAVDSVEPQQLD